MVSLNFFQVVYGTNPSASSFLFWFIQCIVAHFQAIFNSRNMCGNWYFSTSRVFTSVNICPAINQSQEFTMLVGIKGDKGIKC